MTRRKRMFFGLPCLIWKLVALVIGVIKKETPIPLRAKIAGEMEIKSLVIAGGWTAEWRIRPRREARRAPSECWAESNSWETNYDQRRESKWNTRWGLMTRILMVCVRSG